MKAKPRISDAEWLVMKVVWRRAECPAQEVIEDLAKETRWSAATVKTLLNRLVRKRALRYRREGKSYIYSAAVAEESCRGAEADSFLQRVFDGALSPMMMHFVRSRRLTGQEIRELEDLLKTAKGDR